VPSATAPTRGYTRPLCARGGIGRRARLRALWGDFPVMVRVHSGACEKPCSAGLFRSRKGPRRGVYAPPCVRASAPSYSDGNPPTVKYEYNADGERTKMIDGSGTTTSEYDQLDRLTETKDGHRRCRDSPASSADLAGPPHVDEDFLVLSTVHSAKGLEWDAVHRPHRSLELRPPRPKPTLKVITPAHQNAVQRRDQLGGLIQRIHPRSLTRPNKCTQHPIRGRPTRSRPGSRRRVQRARAWAWARSAGRCAGWRRSGRP
jgi:YD repeat-containing protein